MSDQIREAQAAIDKAARLAEEVKEMISKIDSTDVIPPVQMLQILKVLNERRELEENWRASGAPGECNWENVFRDSAEMALTADVEDLEELRDALVLCAASAIAWLEAIERRKASH